MNLKPSSHGTLHSRLFGRMEYCFSLNIELLTLLPIFSKIKASLQGEMILFFKQ